MIPGEFLLADGEIPLNAGRETVTVQVANTGDRPIQVGSHTHFFEVNRALAFERRTAYGFRLMIPAGTALRFEPGESREVTLVHFAGAGIIYGMNALVSGELEHARAAAFEKAEAEGFKGS